MYRNNVDKWRRQTCRKRAQKGKKKKGGGGGGGGKEDTFGNYFICTVFILISHKITCNNNGYGTICGDKLKACIKNCAQALRSYTG